MCQLNKNRRWFVYTFLRNDPTLCFQQEKKVTFQEESKNEGEVRGHSELSLLHFGTALHTDHPSLFD